MSDRPIKPDDADCCGSGCKPCIFDVYEERLKKWELDKEKIVECKVLDQIKYLPFLITSVENLDELLKVFQFQAVIFKKTNLNSTLVKNGVLGIDFDITDDFLPIKTGEYLILKGVNLNETISRSYTPVLCREDFLKGMFKIIVSLIPNGKMSDFWSNLETGDIVFWRGPYRELSVNLSSFKHILLFGGGTGVVPLYNIAKSIVEDDESETWVNAFLSFKNQYNFVLRNEFARLRDFWNFKMKIFITNDCDFKPNYNEVVELKRIEDKDVVNEVRTLREESLCVIVCGPEGFNYFIENSLKSSGLKDENIFIFW